MKDLKLKIVTQERVVFSNTIKQVSVETTSGQITILANHIPLVSELSTGEIIITNINNEEEYIAVSGGFIEVLPKQVVILADSAERAEEIDEEKAEKARKKAEELLKTKMEDTEQFTLLKSSLQKELARLKVARKYKKRGVRTSVK